MNALPIELVRHILTFRGTNTFEALHTNLTTTKKHTYKWLEGILKQIVDADLNDEITHKEFLILTRIYNKYDTAKRGPTPKLKAIAFHPDA